MKFFFSLTLFYFLCAAIYAQHDSSMQMHHDINNMNMRDTTQNSMPAMQMNDEHNMQSMDGSMHQMPHSFSLNLPMSRNGSGTAWSPDAAPMYGQMYHSQHWMYMLHYNLFLRYNKQDLSNNGSRGNEMFDAPNWLMFMGQRQVERKVYFVLEQCFLQMH